MSQTVKNGENRRPLAAAVEAATFAQLQNIIRRYIYYQTDGSEIPYWLTRTSSVYAFSMGASSKQVERVGNFFFEERHP